MHLMMNECSHLSMSVSVGFILGITKLKNAIGFLTFPSVPFKCLTHVSASSCFPWRAEHCNSISMECQFTLSGYKTSQQAVLP